MNKNKLNKEYKLKVVRKVLDTDKSLSIIAKEEGIDVKLIIEWTKKYNLYGDDALSLEKKIMNTKQKGKLLGWELENLSLKKIYTRKGDGLRIILRPLENLNF